MRLASLKRVYSKVVLIYRVLALNPKAMTFRLGLGWSVPALSRTVAAWSATS